MPVSRASWPVVVPAVLATAAVHVAWGAAWASPLWILVIALLFLFRDPERKIPPSPLAVVSPVDGRVLAVTQERDPFRGEQAQRIRLRMSWLGTCATRSPIEGGVMQMWFVRAGAPFPSPAAATRSSEHTHYAMWIQTDEGDNTVITLHGLLINHRLRCLVQVGERIGQGKRCGFVLFPTAVDLYLPATARIQVTAGETVRAGSKILATFVHHQHGTQ